MVICLQRDDADLHMAQLMPLPLTVSCVSKIQIGFTFLVPAHPGSPVQRSVKRVCVYVGSLHKRSRVRLLAVPLSGNNLGQVVHTHVPLSPSSIIWCRSRGGDALRLGR